jgi:Asp-tRNA(Asn)/Glu-tRNA(Gln) amidotransferase C subunit
MKESKEEDDLSLSKLELEEEESDKFPSSDLEKIINLIEELNKMLILTKMSDIQIQDFVRNNLTKEAKQIKDQYKKYIKVLPSSDLIRQQTYAILLKLGICKPTKFVVEEKSV